MKITIAFIILLLNPLMVTTAHTTQDYTVGSTQYVSARKGLSLRTLPAKNSHRIVIVPYRNTVLLLSSLLTNKPLTERGIKGYWVKVEYQGKTGFMFSGYLRSQAGKKPIKKEVANNKSLKRRTSKRRASKNRTRRNRISKNRNRKRRSNRRKNIKASRESKQANIKCYNTPKNYIIGQAQENGAGTLVLIKYKSYTNDKIACKYIKHEEDFVIKLGKTVNIHGAKGDFLVLNQASPAGSRGITVWNLAERKIAYTGAYRKMITITPEHLIFWRATKTASIDQCPGLKNQNWAGGAIMATKVRLHFSDSKLNYSNETRCFPKN